MRILLYLHCFLTTVMLSETSTVYDRFTYGVGYPSNRDNPIRIQPSSYLLSEVCEGESFVLECPPGEVIKLAKHGMVRFGRNGDWERRTRCGDEDVRHCRDMSMKRLLQNCSHQEACTVHLTGEYVFSEVDEMEVNQTDSDGPTQHGDIRNQRDPCPPRPGDSDSTQSNTKPRKYLTLRYSCVHSIHFSGSGTSPQRLQSYTEEVGKDGITKSTEMMLKAISSASEVTDQLKESVAEYLENLMTEVRVGVRGFQGSSPISILNNTGVISKELQGLMDRQTNLTECEIRTSQMTLKVIRKQMDPELPASGGTSWKSDNSRIVLPDQVELLDDREELKLTLASYRNLQEELDSASDVISVSVDRPVNLSKPVTFLLANNGTKNVSCAYWSFPEDYWAQDGCRTVCHNETHTKCSCDHLTNFALIFNVHEEFIGDKGLHSTRLTLITYVGFSISILCMVLTLVLFLTIHANITERDVIHVNLCISLLTAELIFLFGIERTEDANTCTGIAGLLHFFFLASFAWMFLEGYQIYVLLVKVFETRKPSSLKNFLIGYLVPLIIVGISFTVDYLLLSPTTEEMEDICYQEFSRSSYGTSEYCWLRVDNHFILSFIIPAVLVIFSNFCFLIFAIYSMFVHKQSNGSHRKLIVSYMKGVGVLMCLLGSTWITGLLYLVFNNIYLAYSFTILNSIQGVGIFLFQGLLNPTIRAATRRKFYSSLHTLGLGDHRGRYSKTQGSEFSEWVDGGAQGRKRKKKESVVCRDEIENVEQAYIST